MTLAELAQRMGNAGAGMGPSNPFAPQYHPLSPAAGFRNALGSALGAYRGVRPGSPGWDPRLYSMGAMYGAMSGQNPFGVGGVFYNRTPTPPPGLSQPVVPIRGPDRTLADIAAMRGRGML